MPTMNMASAQGRTINGYRITNISPAGHGWWVRFNASDGAADSWVSPVACWVVAENEEGEQRVAGMSPSDDDDGSLTGPHAQEAHYFYDPEFVGGRSMYTRDLGPRE